MILVITLALIILLYISGKSYKITYGELVSGRNYTSVSDITLIPDANIEKNNDTIQITTHFGTYTEDDAYFDYNIDDEQYRVYNEFENTTYSYNKKGEIINIEMGNAIEGGGVF